MKLNITVIIAVLVMGAGAALGQEFLTISEHSDVIIQPEVHRDELEVWNQEWSVCPASYLSQTDLGVNGISGECTDDFISGTDYAVTSVVWWGAQVPGATLPEYFIITFYLAFPGDCSQPNTGTILSQQTVSSYNQQSTGYGLFNSYSATLDPVFMNEGWKYWISIRAAFSVEGDPDDFETWSTAWYWASNDVALECPALFRGDFFGEPDWIIIHERAPSYPCGDAFAFCLYSDMAVVTEAQSWGSVKTLFR